MKEPRYSACLFWQKLCVPLSGSESLTTFGPRAKPDLLLEPKACGSREYIWQENPVFKGQSLLAGGQFSLCFSAWLDLGRTDPVDSGRSWVSPQLLKLIFPLSLFFSPEAHSQPTGKNLDFLVRFHLVFSFHSRWSQVLLIHPLECLLSLHLLLPSFQPWLLQSPTSRSTSQPSPLSAAASTFSSQQNSNHRIFPFQKHF